MDTIRTKCDPVGKKAVSDGIKTGKIFSFYAYGTLREGDYNYEHYKSGIRALSSKSYLGNFSLWTHGPFPYLVPDSQRKHVIVEEIEFVDKKVALDILEMELAVGYEPGLIKNKLIFYWPGNPEMLSSFLNLPVVEIPSGDWFDYHSTSAF